MKHSIPYIQVSALNSAFQLLQFLYSEDALAVCRELQADEFDIDFETCTQDEAQNLLNLIQISVVFKKFMQENPTLHALFRKEMVEGLSSISDKLGDCVGVLVRITRNENISDLEDAAMGKLMEDADRTQIVSMDDFKKRMRHL